MSRLGIVMFFATALLASASLTRLSSDATAQEKTLWQQLIGPWDLVSCTNKQNPICSNPSGSVVYTVSGRYMVMLTEKGRPIEVANFGTWSVDEATKTLSYRVESALVPKSFVVQYGEGSENKFPSSSLTGDELKYSGATLGEIIWHRHGQAFVQPVSQTR